MDTSLAEMPALSAGGHDQGEEVGRACDLSWLSNPLGGSLLLCNSSSSPDWSLKLSRKPSEVRYIAQRCTFAAWSDGMCLARRKQIDDTAFNLVLPSDGMYMIDQVPSNDEFIRDPSKSKDLARIV